MLNAALHFAIGSAVALAIFLACAWYAGTRQFSAPTAVVLIGFFCAALSHFLSPWATPAVLVLYAVASINECRAERAAQAAASRTPPGAGEPKRPTADGAASPAPPDETA